MAPCTPQAETQSRERALSEATSNDSIVTPSSTAPEHRPGPVDQDPAAWLMDGNAVSDALLQGGDSHHHLLTSGTIFDEGVYQRVPDRIGREPSHIFRHITPLVAPSPETFALMGSRELEDIFETIYFYPGNKGDDDDCARSNKSSNSSNSSSGGGGGGDMNEAELGLTYQIVSTAWSGQTASSWSPSSEHPRTSPAVPSPNPVPVLHVGVLSTGGAESSDDPQRPEDLAASWAKPTLEWFVKMHRRAGRLDELDGQLLVFSMVHDNRRLRIMGHGVRLANNNADNQDRGTHDFKFETRLLTSMDNFIEKNRWAGYHFSYNLYHIWVPRHLQRIRDLYLETRGLESPESKTYDWDEQPGTHWGRQRTDSPPPKGNSDHDVQPVLLTAHQDVVPVSESEEAKEYWKYKPQEEGSEWHYRRSPRNSQSVSSWNFSITGSEDASSGGAGRGSTDNRPRGGRHLSWPEDELSPGEGWSPPKPLGSLGSDSEFPAIWGSLTAEDKEKATTPRLVKSTRGR